MPAHAEDRPPTAPSAAADLVAAHEAGDEAAFETLARRARPDPWLVVEELCAQGAVEAAHRFAEVAPVASKGRLRAYVAGRGDPPDGAKARSLVRLARTALERGNAQAALAVLDDLPSSRSALLSVDVAKLRGEALRQRRDHSASSEAFRGGAEIAATVGWTRGVAQMLSDSAASAAHGANHTAALARWQRVVELARQLEDELTEAGACTGLGAAHRHLGAYAAALSCHLRARRLYEEQSNRSGVARALGNEAIVRRCLGQLSEALALQEQALAIHRELEDASAVATTLGNIGVIHASRGDLDGALGAQREALALKERLHDARGAVLTLTNIGALHLQRGDYERALEVGQRALELNGSLRDRAGQARARANLAQVHAHFGAHARAVSLLEQARDGLADLDRRAEQAAVLSNLGVAYRRMGDLPAALEAQTSALALYEALADPAGRALAHVNLGVVHGARAAYPEALAHQWAALEIARAHEDAGAAAAALGGLGNIHLRLGAYDQALDFHRQSLAMNEKRSDQGALASSLTSIGALQALRGDVEAARSSLEQARAYFAKAGDVAAEAGAIVNLALLRQQAGESEGALSLLAQALERRERVGDDVGAALVRVNQGLVHAARGEAQEARDALRRALAWAEEAAAVEVLVRANWGLAATHLRAGEPREAAARAHAAVDHLGLLVGGQDEELGAQAREQYLGVFATGARAGAALDDAAEVAFFLESGRAGALLEALGGREALQAELVTGPLRQAEAEARAAERRALALFRHAHAQRKLRAVRERRQELHAARERLRRVIERIQREAKASAHLLYPRADDLETIRGRLDEGETLVLYGLFRETSIALVCSRDTVRLARLAAYEEIVEACESLSLDGPPYVDEGAVAHLRTLLLDPLALGPETRRLLVSPDGILGYVPFCLLDTTRPIAYLPSATTLGHLRQEGRAHGREVLALGDPDYGATRRNREEGVYAALYRTGLPPLPASRAEAEAVGDVVRVGADASEKGFRTALATRESWRGIHFACHGLVDPERPTLSSLALSVDDENDGFLTAMEVFRTRIPADLVVLSACETGRGKVVRGEGIVGLTRAFMFAGAPRVLVSLWEVDDQATATLMRKFYELWNPPEGEGLGAAEALRRAQAHVRARDGWHHPRYWAAWSLWGLGE